MKCIIPTRDWVEFLKARLEDIVEDGLMPKEELRTSNSMCNHIVRHLLIMRLRDYMMWFSDEQELKLKDNKDLLCTLEIEIIESLVGRVFPNFHDTLGVDKDLNNVLIEWGELIELEVIEPLDNLIQDYLATTLTIEPTWRHTTIKQMGNSYILTMGEDYRAIFWDRYRTTV